jgi:hypothetical protein
LRLNRYNAPVKKRLENNNSQIKWSLVTKLISGLLDKNENITAMVTNENTNTESIVQFSRMCLSYWINVYNYHQPFLPNPPQPQTQEQYQRFP